MSFENQENIRKLEIPEGYKPYYAVSLDIRHQLKMWLLKEIEM
jgi:hypothetical protein